MKLSLLSKKHLRENFHSGEAPLDDYLRRQATQDMRNRDATCYVLTEDDSEEILGCFTLSQAYISRDLVQVQGLKSLYSCVPVTLLGRLAVSLKWQKKGIGTKLVFLAIRIASNSEIASHGLLVDLKKDDLQYFYEHLGFVTLPESTAKRKQCFFVFPKRRM